MPNTLIASYVFYSNTTGHTYVLNLNTQPLTQNIRTLDNPNCTGYPIINGTLTKVKRDGSSQVFTVPGGKVLDLYNGLWPNAANSPETGGPLCQGIERLFVNFTQSSNNTTIFALDPRHIQVVSSIAPNDTAVLLNAVFPPQPASN